MQYIDSTSDQTQNEHILVCLSSSPSNAQIIRCAARMAQAFQGGFTALFVQNTKHDRMSPTDRQRLEENTSLARKLGAQIETVFGDDIAYQIAEYARLSKVTKIVIGRSTVKRGPVFWKSSLVDQLLYHAPNMDIHIIPNSDLIRENYRSRTHRWQMHISGRDLLISVLMIMAATVLGMGFHYFGLSDANIMTVYILSVLLISLMTTSYAYGLFSSALAVIVFNYMFTEPKYTLLAYDAGYPVTFVVMFIASCMTANLASRLKKNARHNAEAAYRTKILLDTEQLLSKVHGMELITALTAQQVVKLLGKNVVLYTCEGKLAQDGKAEEAAARSREQTVAGSNAQIAAEGNVQRLSGSKTQITAESKKQLADSNKTQITAESKKQLADSNKIQIATESKVQPAAGIKRKTLCAGPTLSAPRIFMAENGEPKEAYTSLAERQVAEWVLENRHHAGYATRHFPNAICQYYAIALNLEVFAVVGIDTEKESIGTFESSILISILGECALALENEKNAREKEEAHVQAQKEQTRANLIRAISHDLRTPLTTITGNASYLLSEESCFDEQMKRQIYSDIYDDSMWLNDLVDNLLSISRIEDGTMRMHPTAELLDECVEEALKHLDRRCCEHTIVREYAPDLVLVNVEARLIVQLVINLVNNAIKYTQKGSTIWVRIRVAPDGFAYLEVADDGPGVADEEKEHIFEMFYTSGRKAADSRRSLGLGLALCRSIVQAHGGEIRVLDNEPCGTRFVCTLPLTQMDGMQELS